MFALQSLPAQVNPWLRVSCVVYSNDGVLHGGIRGTRERKRLSASQNIPIVHDTGPCLL